MLFQRSLVALLGHPVSVVRKGALQQCSCQQRLHVLKIALLDRISARPSVELMTDCTKQQSQSCCIEREIDRALGPVHHSPIRRCNLCDSAPSTSIEKRDLWHIPSGWAGFPTDPTSRSAVEYEHWLRPKQDIQGYKLLLERRQ